MAVAGPVRRNEAANVDDLGCQPMDVQFSAQCVLKLPL